MTIDIGDTRWFTNRCGVTGLDEACVARLSYVPDRRLVELGSFRARFAFGTVGLLEEVACRMFDELVALLAPHSLAITVALVEPSLTPWSVTVRF